MECAATMVHTGVQLVSLLDEQVASDMAPTIAAELLGLLKASWLALFTETQCCGYHNEERLFLVLLYGTDVAARSLKSIICIFVCLCECPMPHRERPGTFSRPKFGWH
jgi:hypothetical protein